jgi:hypothetical protein
VVAAGRRNQAVQVPFAAHRGAFVAWGASGASFPSPGGARGRGSARLRRSAAPGRDARPPTV